MSRFDIDCLLWQIKNSPKYEIDKVLSWKFHQKEEIEKQEKILKKITKEGVFNEHQTIQKTS